MYNYDEIYDNHYAEQTKLRDMMSLTKQSINKERNNTIILINQQEEVAEHITAKISQK